VYKHTLIVGKGLHSPDRLGLDRLRQADMPLVQPLNPGCSRLRTAIQVALVNDLTSRIQERGLLLGFDTFGHHL